MHFEVKITLKNNHYFTFKYRHNLNQDNVNSLSQV
jgi:hypothetical protein